MSKQQISIWEMYEQYYKHVVELFYKDKFSEEYYKAVENMKNLLVACESLENVCDIMDLNNILNSANSNSNISVLEINSPKSTIQYKPTATEQDKQHSEIITDMAIEHYNNAIEQARNVIKRDINLIRSMTQKEALEYIEQLLGGN